jgi:hypothetical protein
LHEHNIYQHSDITELLKILNTFQCI